MMLELDGIGLILSVRKEVHPTPPIMMLTSISDAQGKFTVWSDFFNKAISKADLITHLNDVVARMKQALPVLTRRVPKPISARPPFVGVVVAASTRGPSALTSLFKELLDTLPATVL
jgi:chemotaxis response regulator CheB